MKVIASKGPVIDGAIGVCSKCNNPVVLALTARGAMLPLETEPNETGALAASVPGPGRAPLVRYLRGDDRPAPGEQRMKAHWDLHPKCKGDRRKRNHAQEHDHRQADGRATPPRAKGGQRVMGKQTRRSAAPGGPETAQEGPVVLTDEAIQAQLEAKARELTMGHIDPGTGRNKRETGKLAKKVREGSKGGAIRRTVGTAAPRERRIDQKRRNKTGRG